MYKKILAAVNEHINSEVTARYALHLARACNAKLYTCFIAEKGMTQHYLLLQRNLLYTAITRGKKLVVIIGTKKALGIAIRNNRQQLRYTRLKERLNQK